MSQKYIKKMEGFKATDKDMVCSGDGFRYQFALGKWYEVEGDLELCKNGFHFCAHPSGVWNFYNSEGTRVFKVMAENVLETPFEPGADRKLVCRRIMLTTEVIIGGDRNTGDWNTGNLNTGDRNTGHGNTGNLNTGDRNTGNLNTGDWNTGNLNTGNWNTGDRNTGDWNTGNLNTGNLNTGNWNTGHGNTGNLNTGDRNTGNLNTGDRNTGHGNTGNWNTGDGNFCNFSSGFFCQSEPKIICFDKQTKFSREEFQKKFGDKVCSLSIALQKDDPINFEDFKELPGITEEKLKSLHEKHQAGSIRFEITLEKNNLYPKL